MTLTRRIIKTILKQKKNGKSIRKIASKYGLSRNTVRRYIRLQEKGELIYPVKKICKKTTMELVTTSKKLLKKKPSRHLYSNRNFGNRIKMEEGMVGARANSVLKQYCEMYEHSRKHEKSNLLDEFCKITKYHRKYAIHLLKGGVPEKKERKPREKKYCDKTIYVIDRIWKAADYPWSERLVALIPVWLPWIKKQLKWMTPELEQEVLSISARQIDRRLKDQKKKLARKMYGRTKPGKLLKHQIPIKTDNWDVSEPGFTEVDLVSHSGPNASGTFIHSLNITDILLGWVETMPIMGKSEKVTLTAIEAIIKDLPFTLRGIDSDNGSEFINNLLFKYCENNNIQFTRSRPYKKDDNAHIEQKNWTHVRRVMGYERYDSLEELAAIRDLYRNSLNTMMNYFQPCVKLAKKVRIGAKIKRVYEKAITPLDRLVNYYKRDNISIPKNVLDLISIRKSIDPFKLSKEIEKSLQLIKSNKSSRKTTNL